MSNIENNGGGHIRDIYANTVNANGGDVYQTYNDNREIKERKLPRKYLDMIKHAKKSNKNKDTFKRERLGLEKYIGCEITIIGLLTMHSLVQTNSDIVRHTVINVFNLSTGEFITDHLNINLDGLENHNNAGDDVELFEYKIHPSELIIIATGVVNPYPKNKSKLNINLTKPASFLYSDYKMRTPDAINRISRETADYYNDLMMNCHDDVLMANIQNLNNVINNQLNGIYNLPKDFIITFIINVVGMYKFNKTLQTNCLWSVVSSLDRDLKEYTLRTLLVVISEILYNSGSLLKVFRLIVFNILQLEGISIKGEVVDQYDFNAVADSLKIEPKHREEYRDKVKRLAKSLKVSRVDKIINSRSLTRSTTFVLDEYMNNRY